MSKELTQNDRNLLHLKYSPDSLPIKCLTALEMAEHENELLREKVHTANQEIDSLSNLNTQN